MREVSLQCVAHFWCSAVTVCLCGFLRCLSLGQKIDSNITLLPLPLPPHGTQPSNTHKHTHVNHVILTLLASVPCGRFSINSYLFMSDSLIHCVPYLIHDLVSHFLFSLPVLSFTLPLCLCSLFLSFRVTWLPALVNQVGTSTTPWCCTTTTAPAGQSRSSCPSQSTCFGGRTSGLSSDTAPVSGNGMVDNLYLSQKG